MMRRSKRLAWILSAAASLAVGGMAQAQFRVGGDGRYREQNNLIGSGGYNATVPNQPGLTSGNFNNSIITGDVTGGRNFRSNGQIDYTSPTAFRGPVNGQRLDQFIQNSSAAPYGGIPQDNAQAVRQYFGTSKGVAAPAGYVQQAPGSNGYVPAPVVAREAGDLRMGQVMSNSTTILPKPGQLVMPGPVDPNTQTSTVITASPLFGVRQFNPAANVADDAFLQHSLGGGLSGVRMDPALAAKMRSELMQSDGQPMDSGPMDQQGPNGTQPNGTQTAPGKTRDPNAPLQGGFDSPQNNPLANSTSLANSDSALTGSVNSSMRTGAGTRHQLNINHPRIRSEQLTELDKRLEQYRSVQELNELSNSREFNQQVQRAKQLAEENPNSGITVPGATGGASTAGPSGLTQPRPGMNPVGPGPLTNPPPGRGAAPITTGEKELAIGPGVTPPVDGATIPKPTPGASGTTQTPPATPSGRRPMPLEVNSLAEGVQGEALADLMKQAEELNRGEHYTSALEKYDMAELVVPNSPIIQLGRANVELGRTYYARAEQDLRQAFTQDPALLLGRYNLKNMIGQDRLEVIIRDLRSVAEREPTEARPVFLLSYIFYNTNDGRMAAAYLDLAEKRSGGKDSLYPTLRKYWLLPTDGAAPADLNK